MADKTSGPHSTPRRHSQVFVDVPLPSMRRRNSDESTPGPSLKENTPLRPSRTNSQAQIITLTKDAKLSKKRKANEDDSSAVQSGSGKSKAKKPKLDNTAPQPAQEGSSQVKKEKTTKAIAARTKQDNDSFRCHQCQRWWPNGQGLRCTLARARPKTSNERCTTQYCFTCIHKYERLETLDSILSRDVTELPKELRQRHLVDSKHWFECYRCRNECDCHICRKARGQEPIGNLKQKARQAEKAEAKAREQTLKTESSSPTKAKKQPAKKARHLPKSSKATEAEAVQATKAAPKPKPKPKLASKPKPHPKPLWTRVDTNLALEDAEARVHIREFIVRFASALQVPHSCLDELEEISGENLGSAGGWDVEVDDGTDIAAWVSELCVKSVIQGLLDAIAGWADAEGDYGAAKALKEAVKSVKTSGSNLNRVWGSLISLREVLGTDTAITFSDPLLPPASTAIRTTRSAMHANDSQGVLVSTSAQLIPVITDLVEHAMQSPVIREALDAGSTEEKELNRIAKEATTKENARWKNFSGTKNKQRRDQHNKLLHNIELSQRLASIRFIPRWAPLGQDFEGRVYYAMTPGVGESDAAMEFLNGKESRVKIGRKRDWTEDDRKEMQRWSWFIAVWGKKPEDAEEAQREDKEEERDADEETWWGFWQPAEIQKLAEWLAIKAGLGGELSESEDRPTAAIQNGRGKVTQVTGRTAPSGLSRDVSPLSDLSDSEDENVFMKTDAEGRPVPVKRELEALTRGLRDYADLLEWREQRASRERSASPEPAKSGKKPKKTTA